jgi:hypothetical protein
MGNNYSIFGASKGGKGLLRDWRKEKTLRELCELMLIELL